MRKVADMRHGKYQITAKEQANREKYITQALAIFRLEEQCPGPHGMALFQKYIDGDHTFEECLELRKEVAILDLKLQYEELCKKFNISST